MDMKKNKIIIIWRNRWWTFDWKDDDEDIDNLIFEDDKNLEELKVKRDEEFDV